MPFGDCLIVTNMYRFISNILKHTKDLETYEKFLGLYELRSQDLNLRPSGYEPDELPTAPLRDIKIWQPPTLPVRLQTSTIGRLGLNLRVRYGNGCVP